MTNEESSKKRLDPARILRLSQDLSRLRLSENSILLYGENRNILIEGELPTAVVDACESYTDLRRLATQLKERYESQAIHDTVEKLIDRRVLAYHFPKLAYPGMWPALGISEEDAADKLTASSVGVTGDKKGILIKSLHKLNIPIANETSNCTLRVFFTSDFTNLYWKTVQSSLNEKKQQYILMHADGGEVILTPVYGYGTDNCWNCLRQSFLRNRPIHRLKEMQRIAPVPRQPYGLQIACEHIAAEIAKWLVDPAKSAIRASAWRLSGPQFSISSHSVPRWPQCPHCGEPKLFHNNRLPRNLEKLDTKSVFRVETAGGFRLLNPSKTRARWTVHVDPLLGAVTKIFSPPGSTGDVFASAATDIVGQAQPLNNLRDVLSYRSQGKGASKDEAVVSALGEAFERHSVVFRGDEPYIVAEAREIGSDAIFPNQIQLFSESQLRDETNTCAEFKPSEEIHWSPAWSLIDDRFKWVPTSLAYFGVPTPRRIGIPDSNGIAAGNTLEEAAVQAFLELIERDAFAIWWMNGIPRHAIEPSVIWSSRLERLLEEINSLGRSVRLLNITSDLNIPVIAAISWVGDSINGSQIVIKAGAHFDPSTAACRAIGEILQFLIYQKLGWTPDQTISHWLQSIRISDLPQLNNLSSEGETPHFVNVKTSSLEACLRPVRATKLDFLVMDLTRPELKVPVVRVISPGLRHYWRRLGKGRLYDVPVAMGWCDMPRREEEMLHLPPYIDPRATLSAQITSPRH